MTHDVHISRPPAMFQPTFIPELEDSSIGSSRCRLFLAALEMVDSVKTLNEVCNALRALAQFDRIKRTCAACH